MRERLLKLLNSFDSELEMHLAGYGFGVVVAALILIGWGIAGPRDGNYTLAFSAFLTAVTGGLFKRGSALPEVKP